VPSSVAVQTRNLEDVRAGQKKIFGGRPMSEVGQTETSGRIRATSGLPPATDMRRLRWHVRFVPGSDMAHIQPLCYVGGEARLQSDIAAVRTEP
jgi:hypothetical protein